jgi:hypothetical protein
MADHPLPRLSLVLGKRQITEQTVQAGGECIAEKNRTPSLRVNIPETPVGRGNGEFPT